MENEKEEEEKEEDEEDEGRKYGEERRTRMVEIHHHKTSKASLHFTIQ